MAAAPGPAYNFTKPLTLTRRVIRDVLLGWAGLKEGVVEVAERLNRRVQLLKWSAEAAELEVGLDQLHRQLGERIERSHESAEATTPSADGEIASLVGSVLEVKAGLERLERRIRALKAEGRDDEVIVFLEALRRTGGRLEVVDLPADSPAIGLRIEEVPLPEDVQIAALLHGQVVYFPRHHSRISAGDRLLMIGLDRAMDEAVARLAWPRRR